jgi:hypothetical protein
MFGIRLKITRAKKAGCFPPVLSLITLKLSSVEEEKGMYVVIELMNGVRLPADSIIYRIYVRKFE